MYAPNNIDTAKQISEQLGNQTVVIENISTSTSKGVTTNSKNLQAQSRPLMPPDEVMKLEGPLKDEKGMIKKPGQMIVKVAGFPPILGRQILYFTDPVFSRRSQCPSVPNSDVLIKNLHRTYKRPRYEWLTDDEYQANLAEDEMENRMAEETPVTRGDKEENERQTQTSETTSNLDRHHGDVDAITKEVLGDDELHEKDELPQKAPVTAGEEREGFDEGLLQAEIEDDGEL